MNQLKPQPEDEHIPAPDKDMFYRMFESSSEVMLLIEPVSGRIVDANPSAVNFYGYPKSSLCDMLIEQINSLSAEQVAAERLRALHEERNYFIFPHRLAGGEERIVEVYSSPIELEGVRFLFSTIHDITGKGPADTAIWVRSS